MARQLVEQRKQARRRMRRRQAMQQGHAGQSVCPDAGGRDEGAEPSSSRPTCRARPRPSRPASKSSRNEEVRVQASSTPASAPSTSRDILLASTSNAIVVGFNVRPDAAAQPPSAQRSNVDIRMYRVIYDAIDEIEARHEGHAGARSSARTSSAMPRSARPTRSPSIGTIAGCYVHGRQDRARQQGARAARQHRHLRGRDRIAAALQGLRQGGRTEL